MDSISINPELLEHINRILGKHDISSQQYPAVKLQYLSAIIGIFLAEYPGPEQEKKNLLEELYSFSEHVLQEQLKQQAPPPPKEGALGIWRPDNKS